MSVGHGTDGAYVLGEAVLLAWCANHRISVKLRRGRQSASHYDHTTKAIVASAWNDRARLFMLIHEVGHAVLRNRTSFYLDSSPYMATPGTVGVKLATIQEEFAAWTEGLKLARSLGVCVDERAFDRSRAACLRSYMEQYLYPHRYL